MQGLDPLLNGRNLQLRLQASGPLSVATLAAFGEGNKPPSTPTLQQLLASGVLSPKEHKPTPRGARGRMVYSRVSGVQVGSTWSAVITDPVNPASRAPQRPSPGRLPRWSAAPSAQPRCKPQNSRLTTPAPPGPPTATTASPTTSASPRNRSKSNAELAVALESPLKTDKAIGGLRFNSNPSRSVMFRGTVELSGLDGDANRQSFHLVQRAGAQGPELGRIRLAAGGQRTTGAPDLPRGCHPAPSAQPAACETIASTARQPPAVTQARKRRVFPFTAIVGQEEMKLALLLNVIDPRIGGVMIMGDRGTGKSTTIRALADLLPEIDVVTGDPYNSSAQDPDLQSSEVRQRAEQGEQLTTEKRQVPMVDLPSGRHRRQTLRHDRHREGPERRRARLRTRSAGQGQPRAALCG